MGTFSVYRQVLMPAAVILILLLPNITSSCGAQQGTRPVLASPEPAAAATTTATSGGVSAPVGTNPTIIAVSGDINAGVSAFKPLITERYTGDQSGQRPLYEEYTWDTLRAPYVNTLLTPGAFQAAKLAPTMVLAAPTGTALRVSDNSFSDLNPAYASQFSAYSPKQIVGLIGGNTLDLTFREFLTGIPASVHGFGAVFSDVDASSSTSIEVFNATTSLGTYFVPARSDARGLSFLAISFDNQKITRVRITAGQGGLGTDVNDVSTGGTLDLVALDNILFNEPTPGGTQTAPPDSPIEGGHFYTQARGPAPEGYGFAITDAGGIHFWSEFQRLGGVEVLGYPASQRFLLDGFWTQATQRVLLQWRPEVQQVYFINVFDKLHDLGRDGELQLKYQIPPQTNQNDAGKSFEQVIAERLAWLDRNPALKTYYLHRLDALMAYGLPTSQVVDVGGTFDLIRCQRVVLQYWKVSVPGIANAGEIQVSLGGDIAKVFGLVPPDVAIPSPAP